mmetsp:Transcript_4826/g.7732  ORF Transcript_4826/g.7732 Transcript_4826/m.7732 type:complete len:99 (-) Transcript_4826:355-651(-)|eukprot:CAMPEP_0184289108 /NCGR_PEP_ID=MMETSP1049-20130417/1563_1 /TAXON_ID=77928 /ORGANISM="Proteomonas sulcata, Strain CCMP704" /LENGTH=98 /DNA_ID=CAMNT_0026595765 /DNA_START=579 /DNA_END=875 /DNA_ORIENTATION=-
MGGAVVSKLKPEAKKEVPGVNVEFDVRTRGVGGHLASMPGVGVVNLSEIHKTSHPPSVLAEREGVPSEAQGGARARTSRDERGASTIAPTVAVTSNTS